MSCSVGVRAIRRSARRPMAAEDAHADEKRVLEKSISRHISRYFAGRTLPDGVDPCDRRYVDICLETNMCDAADAAYRAIASTGRFRSSCADGMVAEDVMMVIGVLKSLREKMVPQEFSPGMMLMHLEILEGIPFSTGT